MHKPCALHSLHTSYTPQNFDWSPSVGEGMVIWGWGIWLAYKGEEKDGVGAYYGDGGWVTLILVWLIWSGAQGRVEGLGAFCDGIVFGLGDR